MDSTHLARSLKRLRVALCLLGMLLAWPVVAVEAVSKPAPAPPIRWQGWQPDLFAKAAREHRFVLLDLEAVWCHWCHVMDAETYTDPEVRRIIAAHYLAVKVDQDARPDLANRYEDYGWPATILYAPDGQELVKRSGYIPAPGMAALLQAVVDDPTPGPSIQADIKPTPAAGGFSPELLAQLQTRFAEQYDAEHGGWGFVHKYLDAASLEYTLLLAQRGDADAARSARQTLDAGRKLIDPVWGGVYQYSTGGDWNEPHFEKIMSAQAANLRLYSLAYLQFHDPADLASARAIAGYLTQFLLAKDGGFYTSQDADLVQGEHSAEYFALNDAQRRARGVPRVDRHHYSRENGWVIEALALYARASGEAAPLQQAEAAARWVLAHRRLPGGGFRHDEHDAAGPYLADTLGMARACLSLYAGTGDRAWLSEATRGLRYIQQHFSERDGGYRTAASRVQTHRLRDENAELARLAHLLQAYTGQVQFEQMSRHALRYLAAPELVDRFPAATGLLVNDLLGHAPVHLTVVGAHDDPAARELFAAAGGFPASDIRLEWWDRSTGPLPNPDVAYPMLGKPAAFVCTERRCSAPAFDTATLHRRLQSGIGP